MKPEDQEEVLRICREGGLAVSGCEQRGSVLKVEVQADAALGSASTLRTLGEALKSSHRPYIGLDLRVFAEEQK